MKLSFKTRMALYYLLASSLVIALVFSVIYWGVRETVYRALDHDLSFEALKHTTEVRIEHDTISFLNKAEWEEREHTEVQLNPVFIQVLNKKGEIMDKSPNLKGQQLPALPSQKTGIHQNGFLHETAIRQIQLPIRAEGKTQGYIVAAMSMESTLEVVRDLRKTLLILFPIVVLILFFISRYLAGANISPIRNIIRTTDRISKHNLNQRIPLPKNEDELFELSASINSLLERLQAALEREKQFTSDASHELRTPLSTLQGTLEILIRKPRSQTEYEEKVALALAEIQKMTNTLDQLLLMARWDSKNKIKGNEPISITEILEKILDKYQADILAKNLRLDLDLSYPLAKVPEHYAHLILDNLIHNSIKYSHQDSELRVQVKKSPKGFLCLIQDQGIGIATKDLKHIFNPFFRADPLSHREIPGTGLGLSIVKKAAEAIGAELEAISEPGKGTTMKVHFKEILRIP